MYGTDNRTTFSPDGLTEQLIDALLAEVDTAVSAGARPTAALLEGSAAERRRRRMARRAVVGLVRALPPHRAGGGTDGQVA